MGCFLWSGQYSSETERSDRYALHEALGNLVGLRMLGFGNAVGRLDVALRHGERALFVSLAVSREECKRTSCQRDSAAVQVACEEERETMRAAAAVAVAVVVRGYGEVAL